MGGCFSFASLFGAQFLALFLSVFLAYVCRLKLLRALAVIDGLLWLAWMLAYLAVSTFDYPAALTATLVIVTMVYGVIHDLVPPPDALGVSFALVYTIYRGAVPPTIGAVDPLSYESLIVAPVLAYLLYIVTVLRIPEPRGNGYKTVTGYALGILSLALGMVGVPYITIVVEVIRRILWADTR